MKSNLIQSVKFLRLALVAALLMVFGVLGGCSDDTSGPGDGGGSDVGLCEPGAGKTADDGCNFCKCSDEGQWECTLMSCEDDAGTDADGDAGDDCVEGDTKKVDCNTCTCDAAGSWSCTKIGCKTDDPCEGLACGDACSVCGPDDEVCLPVMHYCDADGQCTSKASSCAM